MDETNQVKGRIMEDTYLVAFLTMKGHIAIPFIRDGDKAPDGFARVAFDVQGDVDRTVNLYYANMDVGVRDYAKSIKDIKSAMWNLKNMHHEQYD